METKKPNQLVTIPVTAFKKPCKPCPPQIPFIWRSMKFCKNVVVAGSLIYYSHRNGAWGTSEESLEFISKLTDHLQILTQVITPYVAVLIWPKQ